MTLDQLRDLKPGSILWDTDKAGVQGLHCKANQDGSKSFFLYYRSRAGQQRRPKIGALGEITLGEARRRARALKTRVASGEDPQGGWDQEKAELDLEALWEKVWADHWSLPRFTKSGWGREAKRHWEKDIKPALGNCKLTEVTAFQVRAWHKKKEGTPYLANRALAILSKMFQWAEEQELRPQHTNPCHLVKKHPEAKRDRFASEAEILRIAPLIEKETEKNLHGVAFLMTLIFTGSRPRFLERAMHEDLVEIVIDGKLYGVLTMSGKSTAKTGDDEKVIVPPQAMAYIKRLPRVEGRTIFGIKMPRKLWQKIKKEAGCKDLWARDWRRTFATIGFSNGVDKGVVGELLNHQSTQTTNIYAKLMDKKRVEAVSEIANHVESVFRKSAASQ